MLRRLSLFDDLAGVGELMAGYLAEIGCFPGFDHLARYMTLTLVEDR